MKAAGVPIVPGTTEPSGPRGRTAAEIGYPVILQWPRAGAARACGG